MWYCCCYPGNSHGSSWLKNLRPHNRRRHSHNDCEWSAYKAHTSHSGGQPLSGNVPHFHFALAFPFATFTDTYIMAKLYRPLDCVYSSHT